MNLGEIYLNHYQQFLGTWDAVQSFEYDSSSVQVLNYPKAMEETHVLASLGLTHHQEFLTDVVEIVVPVSESDDVVMRAVAASLSLLLDTRTPIGGVGYLRHLHRTAPLFFERYGKSAFAFASPYPFPDDFARVPLKILGRVGKVWMGYFLSEAEVKFIERYSINALETLFEEKNIDVIDICRRSAV